MTARILAVIPARGGSKGVPRKNLRLIAGKPLIAWSIEETRRCRRIDRLVVDTDDAEIAAVARSFGAEVPRLRPAHLATDEAPIADALIDLLDFLGDPADVLVMAQCTSPLRRAADIDAALDLIDRTGAPACVSVTAAAKPPQWMLALDADGRIRPLLGWDGFRGRRQDHTPAYLPNGAVFAARVAWFRTNRGFYGPETVAHLMPADRAVDIDTEDDLRTAQAWLETRP